MPQTPVLQEAVEAFSQSMDLLCDDPYEAARTQFHLALTLLDDQPEEAKSVVFEARDKFEKLGAKKELEQANLVIQNKL